MKYERFRFRITHDLIDTESNLVTSIDQPLSIDVTVIGKYTMEEIFERLIKQYMIDINYANDLYQ